MDSAVPQGPARSIDLVRIAFSCMVLLVVGYLFIPYDAPYGSNPIRLELVVYTIPQVLAILGAFIVARRVGTRERTFWSLLTLAMVFVFVYDISWTIAVWGGDPPPAPESMALTVLALVPTAIFFVLLISMTRIKERSRPSQFRFAVEGVIVLIVMFVAHFSLIAEPYLTSRGVSDTLVHLRTAMHSTIGVGILLGIGVTVAWLKLAAWRQWERFFVVGLATYGAALSMTAVYYVNMLIEVVFMSQVHEALLMAGHALVFVAAVSRMQDSNVEIPLYRHGLVGPPRAWAAAVLASGALLAIAAFALLAVEAQPGSLHERLYVIAAVSISLVLVVWLVSAAFEVVDIMGRADRDPVSGVHTLGHFHEWLDRELDLSRRCGEPLTVLFADADGFHRYVDAHGVSVGERLLKDVGAALCAGAERVENVARVEDNLFACLLPGVERRGAIEIAEKMRGAVRDSTPVTLSVGAAVFPEHGITAADLLEASATALRWAKVHGKNRVEFYSAEQRRLGEGTQTMTSFEGNTHLSSVRALAAAVDARHPDTRYHSQGVADVAVIVARELGFTEDRIQLIEYAALMHDVGKIGIADGILDKRGGLTTAERERVREHPVLGEMILSSTSLLEIAPWVRSHHERWDGTGYPDGLAGDAIPLEARILAVCDAYDAMTSPRSYRSRLSPAAALQEIDLNMGTQFDPDVAEVTIRVVREAVHRVSGSSR